MFCCQKYLFSKIPLYISVELRYYIQFFLGWISGICISRKVLSPSVSIYFDNQLRFVYVFSKCITCVTAWQKNVPHFLQHWQKLGKYKQTPALLSFKIERLSSQEYQIRKEISTEKYINVYQRCHMYQQIWYHMTTCDFKRLETVYIGFCINP